ncbi:uncharacterized protein LOC106156319 [Lingula anatina]|uniref:Uncharacterized protein LOC106156319 n=1 Tax=Lingula anatina TaxID=7574 RepID=A0A1S3HLJ3_LINAN|nr:uncharacterized protein LOC106156319 [Lingula anatina]XP_013386971.1 uncharacterized protein LOC106156319 [Lingula anatina]|eukprot:XP_013386970.1 uncharacterized protein LOC106156319 [Lingula anatina]
MLRHWVTKSASLGYPHMFFGRSTYFMGEKLMSLRTCSSGAGDASSRVKIRTAHKKDAVSLTDIYNSESWDYIPETIETFVDIAGDNALVAELDGKVVGSMLFNLLDEKEAFGGLSAIVPELRGKGIVKNMWAERSKRIGDRNLGVFSVLHRQQILHDSGFQVATHRIGLVLGRINESWLAAERENVETEVVTASKVPFDLLLKYDTEIHTIPRPMFLEKYLARPSSKSFVAINKKSGDITGYTSVQPGQTAYRMAPLFADSLLISKLLLQKALQSIPKDAEVDMYLNWSNPASCDFFVKNKDSLHWVLDCVRMFTLHDVPIPHNHKVIAITSPEITLV